MLLHAEGTGTQYITMEYLDIPCDSVFGIFSPAFSGEHFYFSINTPEECAFEREKKKMTVGRNTHEVAAAATSRPR